MYPLHLIPLSELIELLASRTKQYTNMLNAGYDSFPEFTTCGDFIRQIQSEIGTRERTPDNTNLSDRDTVFTE